MTRLSLLILSFPCIYHHLVSTGVAFSRGSQNGSEVLYQWVLFPLRKEENPFKKDHFKARAASQSPVRAAGRSSCAHGGRRSTQAAALIITVLFT